MLHSNCQESVLIISSIQNKFDMMSNSFGNATFVMYFLPNLTSAYFKKGCCTLVQGENILQIDENHMWNESQPAVKHHSRDHNLFMWKYWRDWFALVIMALNIQGKKFQQVKLFGTDSMILLCCTVLASITISVVICISIFLIITCPAIVTQSGYTLICVSNSVSMNEAQW